MTVQSQLGRFVPKAATSDIKVKAMGARAWMDSETLVVRLSQVSDPIIRGMIVAVADHEFGRGTDG